MAGGHVLLFRSETGAAELRGLARKESGWVCQRVLMIAISARNDRGALFGARPWSQRRPSLHDDAGQAPPGAGSNGQA